MNLMIEQLYMIWILNEEHKLAHSCPVKCVARIITFLHYGFSINLVGLWQGGFPPLVPYKTVLVVPVNIKRPYHLLFLISRCALNYDDMLFVLSSRQGLVVLEAVLPKGEFYASALCYDSKAIPSSAPFLITLYCDSVFNFV